MTDNQYIQVHDKDGITDPNVQEFMGAVGDNGYLDFEVLQQKPFMKFWKNLVIHRHVDDDFKYIFFGTNNVKIFETDRTGTLLSEIPNPIRKKDLSEVLLKVIATKQTVYSIGNLKIDEKDYHHWQRVMLPLRRKGEINEVLSFIAFDWTD
jgi:hypothetical protein